MVIHQPVFLNEILTLLNPQPGQSFIDATVNGGGHAEAILERIAPDGRLLGIDADRDIIRAAEKKFEKSALRKNIVLVCENYTHIESVATQHGFQEVNGILFDLGFSSYHIDASGRGFSFLKDEPLDMRYAISDKSPAAREIVNSWSEKEIEVILREYGDERFSRRIARAIVQYRAKKRIVTTQELALIIARSIPRRLVSHAIHPATRTFQALRIAVNHELENIEKALPEALTLLRPQGTLAVISFHSLEDRIVKNIFRGAAQKEAYMLQNEKPLIPSADEIRINPRARSARLRAIQKNNP